MSLNPTLYDALNSVIPGGVRHIRHEGDPGSSRLVRRPGGGYRPDIQIWGESYILNCPYCGDTKGHLTVNYRFGTPDPSTGRDRPLTRVLKCHRRDCLSNPDNCRDFIRRVLGTGSTPLPLLAPAGTRNPARRDPLGPCLPPGDLVPLADLPDTHPAVGYLLLRGFDRQTFRRFDLSFCEQAENRAVTGRIVIPIDFRGVRIGWQARLTHTPAGSHVPKYLTMFGLPKAQILYNFDHARHMPYLVLVEGVTSVWRLGDVAVAALGKDLSEQQARLLAEASGGQRPVVVLLDGGEDQAIWTALHKLQRHRVPAIRVDLPRGLDPADFGRQQLFGLIHEQARAQGLVLPNLGVTG
ncbi:MAG: hypothetical protein GX575_00185 [Candidatus Anammoximicrobium sp.]|nr:hypothetical protein [Candidatus Anammoximicrobium sp.]